jgi:hypothetical protein
MRPQRPVRKFWARRREFDRLEKARARLALIRRGGLQESAVAKVAARGSCRLPSGYLLERPWENNTDSWRFECVARGHRDGVDRGAGLQRSR